MIKALVGKFGTLAMLAAVAGSSVVACSSDVSKSPSEGSAANDGNIGNIGLKLVPVSGVTINSVNYVVTGTPTIPGTALPSGVLPTPGTTPATGEPTGSTRLPTTPVPDVDEAPPLLPLDGMVEPWLPPALEPPPVC